jgi:subtilisin family serine protease
MRFHFAVRLLVGLLAALSFFSFLSTIAPSARAQLVSPELMKKAQSQHSIRVIVQLAISDTRDAWVESDMLQSIRRAAIAEAQDKVRSSLLGAPLKVRRIFEEFPFVVLETGTEGLRVLDSMQGLVIQVVEDQLHAPALAESVPLIQADQAWAGDFAALPLDGSGTVVAVLDTGVDKTHPFLSGKTIEEACFSSNDPISSASSVCPNGVESSFAEGSGVPCEMDGCEHGTHVAGIATGNGADGLVAPFSGVAKGAHVMAVQVFSTIDDSVVCSAFGFPAPPCPLVFTSDVMAALQRVFDLRNSYNFGAVNVSLGGGKFTSPCDNDPIKQMIDSLNAANIPTVVASGNNGFTNALSSPACISSAVSVGSTTDGSGGITADTVSLFSNSASFLSLLAPGYLITSSVPGGGYGDFAGTSMAAPHVAGAFAILKQALPTATVSQMLSALNTTGLPVRDTRNGITKPRIQILNALAQLPTIQFSSATYSVGENGNTATITVTRTGLTSDVSTVQYSTSDGSATAGSDYTAKSGTLVFGAGVTSQKFTITLTPDTIDEANETVNLTLSNPVGSILGDQSTAVLTITDNDAGGALRFSAATYSVSESGRVATITVTRSGGSASGVTVDYATSDGTATVGSDYTATSGTLTFAAGQTKRTFTVPIIDDTIDESNETVNLTLSNPIGGATLTTPNTAVLTIVDNDTGGALRLSAASYTVSETGGSATITVTRKGGTASGVTVDYATADGTATAGSDYMATSGTLLFNVGETSKSFTIPVLDDALAEGNETVNLSLTNPTGGATLGSPKTAVLTIVDDEVSLQFSAATYTVSESGSRATITVRRSGPTSPVVGVTYVTTDGTATAGSDYTATSGTLTFAAGQTSKTFTVPIINDTIDEADERVNLTLSNPTGGAQLGPQSTAVLTITDNDAGGALRFSAATYSVSESGGVATITVTRSGGSASGVAVDYATSDGTATAGSDYTASSGTLIFAAGQTSRTFTVPIIDDTIDEANQTVNLTLSNPIGGATLITPNTAVLTIINNDITNVRGVYALSDSSSLTLTFCTQLFDGTFDASGTINISTQNSRNFSGTSTIFFVNIATIKLAGTLSGTVNPDGQLNGTFSFSSSLPPSSTIVARGNGTLAGSFADDSLTTQIAGQVTTGDTCQITGTLTGTR